MIFFIILAFIAITLSLIAYKLFGHKSTKRIFQPHQHKEEPKSQPGFVKVDLVDASSIVISLALDTFHRFKNQNLVKGIETVQEPKNNRYCYYSCNFGNDEPLNDREIQLNLELDGRTLNFENVYDLSLKQCNKIIEGVEFEQRWSQANSSLEQAFQDYKRFMQELLDFGCQNYFGLAEVRFIKEDYKKLLESGDCHSIAPDLIQFDEFKAILQSEDFSSLDSYFYVGNFTIYIFYGSDYSASFEIEYEGTVEGFLSFFGHDDLYLDHLSLEEKQNKLNQQLQEWQSAREIEEREAINQGFDIDISYVDPFKSFRL